MKIAPARRGAVGPAVRATGRVMLATALAAIPLEELFSDRGWLIDVWVCVLITLLPAAWARMWWRPHIIQLLPGLLLVVCWLTLRYLPDHAVGGVLPLHGSWGDVHGLLNDVGTTIRTGVTPVHTTTAVRLLLSASFAGLALVLDALTVLLRRPALAGIPLLVVYTLSGAVPRHPVSWLYFVAAAVGFLLLLGADAHDRLPRWGRIMPRPDGASGAAGALALSARRIGVIAIAAAVVIPLLLPARAANVLVSALRGHGGSGLGGGSGGVSLDPFVALKGQLTQGKVKTVANVTVNAANGGPLSLDPFYLRSNVLDTFTTEGWTVAGHGTARSLAQSGLQILPTAGVGASAAYDATISIAAGGDNPPIFAQPGSIDGLSGTATWSSEDGLVLGETTRAGETYHETVDEPQPKVSQLDAATSSAADPQLAHWLVLPAAMPAQVTSLVSGLTVGAASPYARALQILRYFSPGNGFVYNLQTTAGSSGSDLVDFLTNKSGFCAQYAAAMAVMLRLAKVPARVVLGYTHAAPNDKGTFAVTTHDAHAWVEAWFDTVGWVPFDPTPLSGSDANRAVPLPWASHESTLPSASSSASSGARSSLRPTNSAGAGATAGSSGGSGSSGGIAVERWLALTVVLLAVFLLTLAPLERLRRRRRRIRMGRGGDPNPLWEELSATATDLGYVWSPARSPRQVASWLAGSAVSGGEIDARARTSLATLAEAVERARYAPPDQLGRDQDGPDQAGLADDLRTVRAALLRSRSSRGRLVAALRPASLRWHLGAWTLGRVGRRR